MLTLLSLWKLIHSKYRVWPAVFAVPLLLAIACNAPTQADDLTPVATWPTLSAETIPTSTVVATEALTGTPVMGPTSVVTSAPTSDAPVLHVVQPGESLTSIGMVYGITVEDLLAANNMQITDTLIAGQVIVIPAGGILPEGGGSTIPTPGSIEQGNALAEYSIDALTTRAYDGGTIVKEAKLANNGAYEQWAISYTSDDIYVTGLMNVPVEGEAPFPVVIMLHGGISQEAYEQGDDTAAQMDYLARQGYLTIAPDYRTYNNTEGSGTPLKIPWVIDVMNLIEALPTLPEADPSRIGAMGHSRGGWLAGYLMVLAPQIDAISLYASLSLDQAVVWEIYNTSFGAEWPAEDGYIYGTPDSNPAGYAMISPINYLSRVSMPVQIHHGTADGTLPVRWSRDLAAELESLGKVVEFYEYPSADHTFYGDDYANLMQRTLDFFNTYVK
jgi:uncharacterized protein